MLVIKSLVRDDIPLIIMDGIALSLYFQGKYKDAKSTLFTGFIIFFVGGATIIYNSDH